MEILHNLSKFAQSLPKFCSNCPKFCEFCGCGCIPCIPSSYATILGSHFGRFLPRRTSKFGQNNCLPNNLLMWVSTFYVQQLKNFIFWGEHFEEFLPRRTSIFGQNKCITNNVLQYEFQLSIFSSSKVLLFL